MRFQSKISQEDLEANQAAMQSELESIQEIARRGIELAQKSEAKFQKRGQLLPRARIEHLLDPGSPFLEIAPLAGYQMHEDKDGSTAGGGLIAGIGYVSNTQVMIVANNSAIKGGTINPTGLYKTLRIQEIVKRQKLPLITLAQSGGANLNYATDIFIEGARTFANQARLSAQGIPQITVVHGNATAGGAYQPGLSDYLVLVEGKSKMFLAGPPLLFAATGEVADDESLGGARMHSSVSGTGEYLAKDDLEGIQIARTIVEHLNFGFKSELQDFQEPRYPTEELLGVVPHQQRMPYDVREIVVRLVDASDFLEFKTELDDDTFCCFTKIFGQSVGIIGNNGPISAAGANKAAQFIQLCEQSGTALLFMHNTTGFLVGTQAEQSGIIKHGSKMIQAVANATVPKLSLVVGGSYGAGNYAMCGRGLDPDFIFSWPGSKTAVMGGEQAGKVLRIVAEADAKRKGIEPDLERLEKLEAGTKAKLEAGSTALFSTARLWDDGIIDPRDSRKVLGWCLKICFMAKQRKLNPNHFGVARF